MSVLDLAPLWSVLDEILLQQRFACFKARPSELSWVAGELDGVPIVGGDGYHSRLDVALPAGCERTHRPGARTRTATTCKRVHHRGSSLPEGKQAGPPATELLIRKVREERHGHNLIHTIDNSDTTLPSEI